MSAVRVAVIGTGADPEDRIDGVSWSMAYQHAEGYRTHPRAELVGCADLERDRAVSFADRFDLPQSGIHTDYMAMIEAVDPDVISVCVATTAHASIVIDCLRAGVPAVHCEKPMAATLADSQRMALEASRHGAQLTFNHQHRFHPTWEAARELMHKGAVGELERLEMRANNLFDHGTHLFDLCNYLTGDHPAEWILGQADCRSEVVHWGVHMDTHGLAMWRYSDGPFALVSTGHGRSAIPAEMVIDGSEGRLLVEPDDGPDLRLRTSNGWEDRHPRQLDSEYGHIHRTMYHVVDAYLDGTASEVSALKALNATELIFGAYESARSRGRVDLPLRVGDNPLESMIESGAIDPTSPGRD